MTLVRDFLEAYDERVWDNTSGFKAGQVFNSQENVTLRNQSFVDKVNQASNFLSFAKKEPKRSLEWSHFELHFGNIFGTESRTGRFCKNARRSRNNYVFEG